MKTKVEIVHTPGTVGGRARIAGTRMPVSTLVLWARQGYDACGIVREVFTHLTEEQVRAALDYYESHRVEIDQEIEETDALYRRMAGED
jgi:uncharacterized protein (DUF433 family)